MKPGKRLGRSGSVRRRTQHLDASLQTSTNNNNLASFLRKQDANDGSPSSRVQLEPMKADDGAAAPAVTIRDLVSLLVFPGEHQEGNTELARLSLNTSFRSSPQHTQTHNQELNGVHPPAPDVTHCGLKHHRSVGNYQHQWDANSTLSISGFPFQNKITPLRFNLSEANMKLLTLLFQPLK